MKFKTNSSLKQHLITHDKKVKCKICSKLVQPRSFDFHMKLHDPYRMKNFKCGICEKYFSEKNWLQVHMASHLKPHKCDKCDKKFAKKRQLEEHEHIHFEQHPFKCDLCVKAYNQKKNLRIHLEEFHMKNPKIHGCGECSFKTTSRAAFYLHRNNHNRCHECQNCGKKFSNFSYLKKHATSKLCENRRQKLENPTKSRKTFPCELCNRKFTTRRVLEEHKLGHIEKQPFKCDLCPKAFSSKKSIRDHVVQIHSSDSKTFICAKCGFKTKSAASFCYHEKSHKKIHGCPRCGKKFTFQGQLKIHLKSKRKCSKRRDENIWCPQEEKSDDELTEDPLDNPLLRETSSEESSDSEIVF
jgi:KRAB domain-containing zinc finger protein